jgi:twitching motility protein PilT
VTIDELLRFMVEQGASDLHIKPMRPPLIRLNGKLLPLKADPLPPEAIPPLIEPTLNERQRRLFEENMAVDFGYSLAGVSRFRGSAFQQRGTWSAVFRRVPFDFQSLEDWGLPPILGEFTSVPQGLVLITGATGAGKSSTLAALLRRITQTRMIHIVTIEDPIEFIIGDDRASVSQREVGTDTPSFELALRNALRQDPDVIMVGEMRDASTIQTVLTAAETGHLVFSTVHTNSAAQTIDRIVDSFPEGAHRQIRLQLASVLEAVVSLRLVERKSGGRVAAVEILRRTPRVSKLIQEGNLDSLEEEIEKSVAYHKMQSMNQSLAALVVNGEVGHDVALAASSNPSDLDLILRKLLYASEANAEADPMAEPMSDFSKIVELQEIKHHYEDLQERHSTELAERDETIRRLGQELETVRGTESPDDGERLRAENERLQKQVKLVRQEFEAKIERLQARIRELAGSGSQPAPAEPERKGFFRR